MKQDQYFVNNPRQQTNAQIMLQNKKEMYAVGQVISTQLTNQEAVERLNSVIFDI